MPLTLYSAFGCSKPEDMPCIILLGLTFLREIASLRHRHNEDDDQTNDRHSPF